MVIEKLTPYLYKIKLKRVIITANHDRLKLCHDREVPEWAQKLSQQMIKGTGYTKEKGGSLELMLCVIDISTLNKTYLI